jgi:uncharacterized membrane protein YsdA (DUF1294 family)
MPPVWILWLILGVNALTWLAFGVDKLLARRFGGRSERAAPRPGARRGSYQRIPESWLLGLAAAGGFVGAWAGIRVFRHKSRKASFLWRLVLSTALAVVWIGGVVWLAVRSGTAT